MDDEFQPPLGETLEWVADFEPFEARIPEDAPERVSHLLPDEPLREELSELPGRPFHDLSNPPMARTWWKYPIYAVIGFPRDLVDGVVGFIGFIPVINLPVTGLAYEVVPTQILFRDPRDWHRWPGRRNRHGHGFIDAESWGWFPTLNMMSFRHIDRGELRQWQRENEELRFELAEHNRAVRASNEAITDRQQTAQQIAARAIEQGDGRTAVQWMLPYHQNYPRDLEAHGLYLASMAMYAGQQGAPAWVEPVLWRELEEAPLQALPFAEQNLARAVELHGEREYPVQALVYVQTRLGRPDQALATAHEFFRRQTATPRSPLRSRLLFEAAMTAGEKALAVEALESLEASLPQVPGQELLQADLEHEGDNLDLARLRLNLLLGEADAPLRELQAMLERRPEQPYYHYYAGVAHLVDLQENPDRFEEAVPAARARLERAYLLAGNPHLRARAEAMLNYLDALEGRESQTEREEPQERGAFTDLFAS